MDEQGSNVALHNLKVRKEAAPVQEVPRSRRLLTKRKICRQLGISIHKEGHKGERTRTRTYKLMRRGLERSARRINRG